MPRLPHVKHRNQNPRRDHQRGAEEGEGADGFAEYEDAHEYPGDGLEGAEDGGSAPADEEGAPLEQGDSPRIYDPGKANGEKPPHWGLGKGKLLCEEADEKQEDGCDR